MAVIYNYITTVLSYYIYKIKRQSNDNAHMQADTYVFVCTFIQQNNPLFDILAYNSRK
jgi:hypothetical protein